MKARASSRPMRWPFERATVRPSFLSAMGCMACGCCGYELGAAAGPSKKAEGPAE